MTAPGPARLPPALARPALEPLWDELARRMAASDRAVTAVTLRELDPAACRALADLLGLDRLPPSTCRVRTAAVAAALGVDPAGLRAVVEHLRGPLGNRSSERLTERQARAGLWAWLEREVEELALTGWVRRLRAAGVPGGDVGAHRRRLEAAVRVLRSLPAGGTSLAGLAADLLGDPHALDPGTWAGTAVLDALATLRGAPRPRTAEQCRALWSGFGVETDELSPTVLVLGLCPAGSDPLSTMLGTLAAAGEPASVTLSQLRRWPLQVPGQPTVHVFENPSIVAEAASRGWREPPLVCSSGWPNVAVLTLLRQLRAGGATLLLHADLDREGLAIVAHLADRVGGKPWKMTSADYASLEASSRCREPTAPGTDQTTSGPAPEVPPRQYEEDVRAQLLDEIAAGGMRTCPMPPRTFVTCRGPGQA